ncbi:hypothetical protein GPALN_010122 [Globodera pallida]|nr:hypothetical protein GPALN_010122 [Globodera pallida]
MFPLDKNKKLIHSSSEPKFFFQNVLKKTNWKNVNEDAILHYTEREFKINKMLSRWLGQNAKPLDEEAFLLKAYFRDVTEKFVTFFTTALEMKTRELNTLYHYGDSLLKCQSEGKLEKPLAQIDGMQMLIKNFCMFLGTETANEKSGKIEEQNMQQFGSLIESKLSAWRSFCENFKISATFTKIETVSKEHPNTTETDNKNVGKFSMNEENIFSKKMISYGGVVTPPGVFKIVVRDEWSIKSAQCAHLMEIVFRDIPQKLGVVLRIRMTLFKYVEGSNLEEFSECFKHFYTIQTNADGEFEFQLPNSVQEIYVHMFPLHKNKRLIHSSIEPKFFLQHVMKKTNWKNGDKDVLCFYYDAITEGKIDAMLSRLFWQNAKPSDEEAFLLKAYLRDVTQKLVALFTNGRTMQKNELKMLHNYGESLLKCQSDGKLEKTLAQIDDMQMLIKNFCMFLGTETTNDKKSSKNEEQNMQRFSSQIESELSVWRSFCKKNLDKIPEKSKFALPNVGTVSKEFTKIDGIKLKKVPKTDETDIKKVIQKATGEAGVFHSAEEFTKIDGIKLKKVSKNNETAIKKVQKATGGTGVFHRVLAP